MIVAVIIVGLFNLILGFAFAAAWDQPWFRALLCLPQGAVVQVDKSGDETSDEQAAPPQILMTNDWKATLQRLNVITEDPGEASWWVALELAEKLRQKITPFLANEREQQLENSHDTYKKWQPLKIEGCVRLQRVVDAINRADLSETPHTDHLVAVLKKFIEANSYDVETERGDELDAAVESANGESANGESANGESANGDVESGENTSHPKNDAELSDEECIRDIHNDVDDLHHMRNELLEWLSRDAIDKSNFDNIPGKLRIDFATKLYNRAGLEYIVRQFYADTEGQETATLMLCNVDQCRVLNERHGVYAMDHVLIELARELDRAIRKERGFDRVARLGGQTLAMFLGYTELDGAEQFSERWRLRVQTTEFQLNGVIIQLTISTAILAFDFHRTLAENLANGIAGLHAARMDGGNVGKRIDDKIRTSSTDEEAPETRQIVLEDLLDPNLGSLIPIT